MVSDLSGNDEEVVRYRFLVELLRADWEDADGPLRLRADLPLAELERAPHFQNARILLGALIEENGTATTATGNLNRKFAERMFEEMRMPGIWREMARRYNKVFNEADVRDLSLLREVCQYGGLLGRRQKRFRATARGRALVAEDQAGRLYRHLFLTFFRKLDLRSVFLFRDVPGIQETLAVILWRLDLLGRDWTPVSGLAELVLLPPVLEQLRAAMVSEHDTEEWILCGYVLEPLLDFGLIERQKGDEWSLGKEDTIRLTPLWRRFLQFPLAPS